MMMLTIAFGERREEGVWEGWEKMCGWGCVVGGVVVSVVDGCVVVVVNFPKKICDVVEVFGSVVDDKVAVVVVVVVNMVVVSVVEVVVEFVVVV